MLKVYELIVVCRSCFGRLPSHAWPKLFSTNLHIDLLGISDLLAAPSAFTLEMLNSAHVVL